MISHAGNAVHIVVAAGGRGFTSEPSGAMMLIARNVPELRGMVGSKNDVTAVKTDEWVLARELFLNPFICLPVPSKSTVMTSLAIVTVTRIGMSTAVKQSLSNQA